MLFPFPAPPNFGFSFGGGGGVPTISVRLTDINNKPLPSLTGLTVAWWDDPELISQVAPVYQSGGHSTNSAGVLNLTSVPGSALTAGQEGWIEVTDSDGTVSQIPIAKVAAGPVLVS